MLGYFQISTIVGFALTSIQPVLHSTDILNWTLNRFRINSCIITENNQCKLKEIKELFFKKLILNKCK